MSEILSQLRDLTAVDHAIAEARAQLVRYPARLEQMTGIEAALQARIDVAQRRLESARHDRRQAEKEVATLREQIAKYLRQQGQVKTNKEYAAITQEIETIQGRIDQWDTTGLEKLEVEDQCQTELTAAGEQLTLRRAEHQTERDRIEMLTAEKKRLIEGLEQDRVRLLATLPEEYRDEYEFMNERHPGSACVALEGEHCSGCNWHLVPQTRHAVKQAQQPVRCEHCHRFLFAG